MPVTMVRVRVSQRSLRLLLLLSLTHSVTHTHTRTQPSWILMAAASQRVTGIRPVPWQQLVWRSGNRNFGTAGTVKTPKIVRHKMADKMADLSNLAGREFLKSRQPTITCNEKQYPKTPYQIKLPLVTRSRQQQFKYSPYFATRQLALDYVLEFRESFERPAKKPKVAHSAVPSAVLLAAAQAGAPAAPTMSDHIHCDTGVVASACVTDGTPASASAPVAPSDANTTTHMPVANSDSDTGTKTETTHCYAARN